MAIYELPNLASRRGASEIIIYRRRVSCKSRHSMTIAMALYLKFLMAMGPLAPVWNASNWIYGTYYKGKWGEDSGFTFTLQSPGGFLILSQFKFDCESP